MSEESTTMTTSPEPAMTQTLDDKSNKDTNSQQPTPQSIEVLLAKARAEEKKKAYDQIDHIKAEKVALEKAKAELEKSLLDTRKQLDGVREGKMSELQSVNEEIERLRNQNSKLEQAIEEVATSAAKKLYESELAAYKASRLRDEGILIPEIVQGNSKEEIDAAILLAKNKEQELRAKLREDVRKEVSVSLPGPLSIDSSQGRGSVTVNPSDRESIANIRDKSKYDEHRNMLLNEAMRAVGAKI